MHNIFRSIVLRRNADRQKERKKERKKEKKKEKKKRKETKSYFLYNICPHTNIADILEEKPLRELPSTNIPVTGTNY